MVGHAVSTSFKNIVFNKHGHTQAMLLKNWPVNKNKVCVHRMNRSNFHHVIDVRPCLLDVEFLN